MQDTQDPPKEATDEGKTAVDHYCRDSVDMHRAARIGRLGHVEGFSLMENERRVGGIGKICIYTVRASYWTR